MNARAQIRRRYKMAENSLAGAARFELATTCTPCACGFAQKQQLTCFLLSDVSRNPPGTGAVFRELLRSDSPALRPSQVRLTERTHPAAAEIATYRSVLADQEQGIWRKIFCDKGRT